jgi:hypothetical protein
VTFARQRADLSDFAVDEVFGRDAFLGSSRGVFCCCCNHTQQLLRRPVQDNGATWHTRAMGRRQRTHSTPIF